MRITRYWKAIIAGLVAGSGALGTAAQDGTLTGTEGLAAAGTALVALVATWRVPNREPKDSA
jgi:hypothetical protein